MFFSVLPGHMQGTLEKQKEWEILKAPSDGSA